MEFNDNKIGAFNTGADFWNDTVLNHGTDEALDICKRYIDLNLKRECSDDEKKFCRELFVAMIEVMADRNNPAKLVYPYDFETANKRLETSYYQANRQLNKECAHAIDDAINVSCYCTNYYNLEVAAMKTILDYGFNRVNLVLAVNLQQRAYDGRFSSANIQWANGFYVQEMFLNNLTLQSHPILIEDFTKYVRKLYTEANAERFTIPGQVEHGESEPVHGYQILRSITLNDKHGFAIGHNPNAPNPYVCWQFTTDGSHHDYYWGFYVNSEQRAIDNFIARIIVHLS